MSLSVHDSILFHLSKRKREAKHATEERLPAGVVLKLVPAARRIDQVGYFDGKVLAHAAGPHIEKPGPFVVPTQLRGIATTG